MNEACWRGYKQIGMKKKGGRTVPNCVKKNKFSFAEWLNENKKTDNEKNKSRNKVVLKQCKVYGHDQRNKQGCDNRKPKGKNREKVE
jgi:hypothetical protein